jgi:hypothetical protein
MASFAHLFRGACRHLQTLVEFAVAGFSHGLVQVTLGKVPGEIVWRQFCCQRARLPNCSFAIFPRGLVRSRRNSVRSGHGAAGTKAQCAETNSKQEHPQNAGRTHISKRYRRDATVVASRRTTHVIVSRGRDGRSRPFAPASAPAPYSFRPGASASVPASRRSDWRGTRRSSRPERRESPS